MLMEVMVFGELLKLKVEKREMLFVD